jgi:hypothetical protein
MFFKRSLFGINPDYVSTKIAELESLHAKKHDDIENELVQLVSHVDVLKRQLTELECVLNNWYDKRNELTNSLFSNHMSVSADIYNEIKKAGFEDANKVLKKLDNKKVSLGKKITPLS